MPSGFHQRAQETIKKESSYLPTSASGRQALLCCVSAAVQRNSGCQLFNWYGGFVILILDFHSLIAIRLGPKTCEKRTRSKALGPARTKEEDSIENGE